MASPTLNSPSTGGAGRWNISWALAVLGLLVALCLFTRLGHAPLFDVDEGAFSEATREMVSSGDYGHTTLNGEPRFDKPILVYWLQAASVRVLGPQTLAFRLPSALCAALWCWSILAFARPRLGERGAWLAAVIAITSVGVLAIGRAATADALLNLLICLAMTDLWRHLELEQHARGATAPHAKSTLMRIFVWMGLGLLAKGPVAVLIPGAVAVLHALVNGSRQPVQAAARYWPGWLVMLLIAVPWYAYAYATQGQAFIDGFFVKHNLNRYANSLEGHSGSLLYYLVVGPLMWLPWTGVLPRVLHQLKATWQDPLGRFLWLWCGFVIGFFSLSGTKLPHYVLYGSTPMFLLMARSLTQPGGSGLHSGFSATLRWAWLLPMILLAAAGFAPQLLAHFGAQSRDPMYRALLSPAQTLAPPYLHYAPWLAAAATVILWRIRLSADMRMVAAASLWAVALVLGLLPWMGELLQGPVQNAARVAATRPETAVQWDVHFPSFSVYRERETVRRPPRPGELALVSMDKLAAQHCADCKIVFSERGIALVLREPADGTKASKALP